MKTILMLATAWLAASAFAQANCGNNPYCWQQRVIALEKRVDELTPPPVWRIKLHATPDDYEPSWKIMTAMNMAARRWESVIQASTSAGHDIYYSVTIDCGQNHVSSGRRIGRFGDNRTWAAVVFCSTHAEHYPLTELAHKAAHAIGNGLIGHIGNDEAATRMYNAITGNDAVTLPTTSTWNARDFEDGLIHPYRDILEDKHGCDSERRRCETHEYYKIGALTASLLARRGYEADSGVEDYVEIR